MLEDMIQKLIDVDRICAKQVEAAKQKKVDIQKSVSVQKQVIYESFLEEQRQKVEEHKQRLEKENQIEDQKQQEHFEQKMKKLEDAFLTYKEQWVSDIVTRCLQ